MVVETSGACAHLKGALATDDEVEMEFGTHALASMSAVRR